MKKKNVALCISGQMRSYKKCYGYLKEYIIEPLEPDIFIDTWRERGGSTKASHGSKASERVTETTLERLYSPKMVRIEDFDDQYYTKKDSVEVPEAIQARGSKGNIPLFYKMKGCNDMKTEYERENDFLYDIVIKLRPDMLIGQEIPREVLNNPHILWFSDAGVDLERMVSDKYFVSSSENMDYCTSVWDHLNEYWANPLGDGEEEQPREGEKLMRYHLEQSDIPYKSFSDGSKILRRRDLAIEQNTPTLTNQFKRVLDFIQRRLHS